MAKSVTERLDGFQRRHPWLGFPLAVIYKLFDDQGTYLAALITYYGFLSLFPLLLLLSSVLGFLLEGNPGLRDQILQSALSQFPVIGQQLGDPSGLRGSAVAVVVGGVVALYGGLGVAQALQNAMNICWAVPRNKRPNPIRARLKSLLLIATAGLVLIGATVLSALSRQATAFGFRVGTGSTVLLVVLSILLNACVLILVFRIGSAHRQTLGHAVPGALFAAVVWQLLQSFGTLYVGHVVARSSATYGVFALVLGLLGWIFLAAVGLVLSVEINVVLAKELYPRALLTPFTDDVNLTEGDKDSYTGTAKAQQAKGFESVDVSFENDGQNAKEPDGGG